MQAALKLKDQDSVAIAKSNLAAGACVMGVQVTQTIAAGHKFALLPIRAGEDVIKYAHSIGRARCDIKPGELVHSHNLAFQPVDQTDDPASPEPSPPLARDPLANPVVGALGKASDIEPPMPEHFMGFRRENGQVGTRNFIAIITSVNCSATAARKIADYFTPERLSDYPNVDGVVAYVHGTGCGMASDGEGFDALQRVMWGYAKHPNNAGVLMVGLGCEMNQIDWLLDAHGLRQGPTFQTMNIQDVAGLARTVQAGIERVEAMLPIANQAQRSPCPLSQLSLALQCGGSDAWSGVTANPALGHASDLLVACGGQVILAETPEIYGAEHLLTRRALHPSVGQALRDRIAWWQAYVAKNGASLDNNPSPGNKRGGLTTILEKSLGAVAKAGTSPLTEVVKYGQLPKQRGFVFMDSPGYDPVSVTGQIASGANLVAFTTGRGSTFGSKPAPCIKIATNNPLYDRMPDDMDINAGSILTNAASVEQVGRQILDRAIQVASGQQSKSELQGLGDQEFVPWQIGATL